MCAEARRLGVLGGTFDPVHLGHLASARAVAAQLGLDRMLLVLSARPPHKPDGPAAPAAARWDMLGLAVEADARTHGDRLLEASDIEVRRDGPSWTVDTLAGLVAQFPGARLTLVLGADAWADVDSWSRPERLLELADVVVTTRPGSADPGDAPRPPFAARDHARYDPAIGAVVHDSGHVLRSCRIPRVEVSATEIRRRVREGLGIDHLTGAEVARYIRQHHLYAADAPPGAVPSA